MFDEPSSYLDVKQRLKAARAIRSLLSHNKSAAKRTEGYEECMSWPDGRYSHSLFLLSFLGLFFLFCFLTPSLLLQLRHCSGT